MQLNALTILPWFGHTETHIHHSFSYRFFKWYRDRVEFLAVEPIIESRNGGLTGDSGQGDGNRIFVVDLHFQRMSWPIGETTVSYYQEWLVKIFLNVKTIFDESMFLSSP